MTRGANNPRVGCARKGPATIVWFLPSRRFKRNLPRIGKAIAEIRRKGRLDEIKPMPIPEWMKIQDFARFIGRSTKTVTRRIDSGELECRTICGARMVRFSPND